MNSSVIRIILGITFLLVKIQAQTCKKPITETKSGFTGADCSNGIITNGQIPDNLGDITFLDVSHNKLTEITESSFSKYASLGSLSMQNVTDTNSGPLKIHEKAFVSLSKLEFLDMSKTIVASPKVQIIWPKPLRDLTIAYCGFESIDVKELKKLTHFRGAYNRFQEFPNFDRYAHLIYIDLEGNSIKQMPLEHVASYCHLTYFNFLYNNFMQNITSDSQYCSCFIFMLFIGAHSIAPGLGDLPNCPYDKAADVLQTCSPNLEPYNVERRLCFRRKDLDITLGVRVLVIAVFIIAILLLIAAARAKPVFIPKVADTHPFEHHDAHHEAPHDAHDVESETE